MLFSTSTAAAMAFALFSSANAHLVMKQPLPPNFAALDSSPLSAETGLCKIGGKYQWGEGTATPATAGGNMEVKFSGSAVHGGGACQFSVNYDNSAAGLQDPTKWKVIHTVEGGCPADSAGNIQTLANDPEGRPTGNYCADGEKSTGTECLRSFDVPIPTDLKNGDAVFAWTWFNRLGNREMYMNCAPITISGASGDEASVAALPSIFVANTGKTGSCVTAEGGVLGFPKANLGQSVIYTPGINNKLAPAVLNKCGAEGFTGEGMSSPPASPVQSPSPAVPSPAVPVTSPSPPSANIGGQFGETAPSPVVGTPPAQSSAVVQPPVAVTPSPAPSTPSTPVTGAEGSVSCSTDGAIVCMPNNQFGICNHGFAVPQGLAAGTECDNGTIQALATRKRDIINAPLTHVRKHARSFVF